MDLPDRVHQGGLPRLDAVERSDHDGHDLGLGQLGLADAPQDHQRAELHREHGPLSLVGAFPHDALHRAQFFKALFARLGHAVTSARQSTGGRRPIRSPAMYARTVTMLTRYSMPSTMAVTSLVEGPRASGGSTKAMSASG